MFLNLSSPSAGGAISDGQGIGSIRASGGGGCTTCLQSTDAPPTDALGMDAPTEDTAAQPPP
jgi:hypothetical protein